MGAGLQHSLVRSYLARLDDALLNLPDGQAAELREQLLGHLDEAIPDGANGRLVSSVLSGLGDPGLLVREVQPRPGNVVTAALGSRRRRRIPRLRMRAWLTLAALCSTAVSCIVLIVPQVRADPLVCVCASGWADRVDQLAAVETSADGHSQTTVPIRPGAEQGFVIDVVNRTRFTQTILGLGSIYDPGQPRSGPFGAREYSLSFGPPGHAGSGFSFEHLTEQLPVTIAPGSYREVKLSWNSATLPCSSVGSETILDQVDLRVRVGWFTRVETVTLPEGVALASVKTSCQ